MHQSLCNFVRRFKWGVVPASVLPSKDDGWLDGLADWYKQLISLSSAFIALTVTFAGNLVDWSMAINVTLMILAWVNFGITIITALCGLRGVTEVRDTSRSVECRLWMAGNLQRNIGMVSFFVFGVWLTIAVGIAGFVGDPPTATS
jgi:hypothetical protein